MTNKKVKNDKKDVNLNEQSISVEDYYSLVSQCAYYKAEQRDFEGGDEAADWYAAEEELNEKNCYQIQT